MTDEREIDLAEYCGPAKRRSSNRFIVANGKRRTLTEWSKETGLSCSAILQRIADGWSEADAVTVPQKNERKVITIEDRTQPITEWARERGIRPAAIRSRLELGWTPEDAVKLPVGRGRSYADRRRLNGGT